MAKRILIVGSKGGSSRTTTTVLLATAIAKFSDQKVGIVDLDPQASAHNWIKNSPINGVEAIRRSVGISQPQTTKNAGRRIQGESKTAYIIVDTQPLVKPTKRMIEEAKSADLILLICGDSPLDIHATKLTVKNLLKTKSLKSKTHLLFSRVVKGTGLSLLLNDSAKTIGVKRLKSVIHFRNCYKLAPIEGWSALNRAAKEEVQTLTIEALTLMK